MAMAAKRNRLTAKNLPAVLGGGNRRPANQTKKPGKEPVQVTSSDMQEDLELFVDSEIEEIRRKLFVMVGSAGFSNLSEEEKIDVALKIQNALLQARSSVANVMAVYTKFASPMVEELGESLLSKPLADLGLDLDSLAYHKLIKVLAGDNKFFVRDLLFIEEATGKLQIIDLTGIHKLRKEEQILIGNWLRMNLPIGKVLTTGEKAFF